MTEQLVWVLTKSIYKLPIWFFCGLAVYSLLWGKTIFGNKKWKSYLALAGCLVFSVGLSYIGVQKAKENMLEKYGNAKKYTSPGGMTFYLPDWLQTNAYADQIGNDIDIAYESVNDILVEEYKKSPYTPEEITVIIMPMLDMYMMENSPTHWATGDTACGSSKAGIRIALRPEVKGENTVLYTKGGYLKPLGWELKNAYNCKNVVGPPDFKPSENILKQTAEVMNALQMPYVITSDDSL